MLVERSAEASFRKRNISESEDVLDERPYKLQRPEEDYFIPNVTPQQEIGAMWRKCML